MNKGEILDKAKELANKEMSEEALNKWYINSKSKGVLDAVQEKVVSRKLLVFLVATSLFVWAGLDPETWGMIAMCYIGGQSAIDFAKIWRG
tara:strand:+ start:4293 stop:4565 length:273 start_codon:yes stop_codon:yes gene_type:complete